MTHQPSARVLSTRSQVIPGSPWCDLLKWSRCNFSVCQGPTLPGLMTLHILDPWCSLRTGFTKVRAVHNTPKV